MTRKKKIIIITSLLITLASIFGFVIIAGAFGPDHSFHKRGMPHYMKKEISEFVLWKLDKNTKELKLDTGQQKKYNAFRTAFEQTINTGLDTKLEFKKQALAEFNKETPDLSPIIVNLQSHIEQMSSRFAENLALFNTFYNSLNADQKKQITEQIKEKHQACRYRYLGPHKG